MRFVDAHVTKRRAEIVGAVSPELQSALSSAVLANNTDQTEVLSRLLDAIPQRKVDVVEVATEETPYLYAITDLRLLAHRRLRHPGTRT